MASPAAEQPALRGRTAAVVAAAAAMVTPLITRKEVLRVPWGILHRIPSPTGSRPRLGRAARLVALLSPLRGTRATRTRKTWTRAGSARSQRSVRYRLLAGILSAALGGLTGSVSDRSLVVLLGLVVSVELRPFRFCLFTSYWCCKHFICRRLSPPALSIPIYQQRARTHRHSSRRRRMPHVF